MSKKKKTTVLKKFRPLTEEELALDLTPILPSKVIPFKRRRNQGTEDVKEKAGVSLIGVIMSVLSLFLLPYVLAPIGIGLGYIGYRRGERSLGLWAVGLGVIGLLGTLIVAAFI